MKFYYVESYMGWFVIKTDNQKTARSVGEQEFGPALVKAVRPATEDEIMSYVANKSLSSQAEIDVVHS